MNLFIKENKVTMFENAVRANLYLSKMTIESEKQQCLIEKIDDVIKGNNDLWALILAYKQSFVNYENAVNSIYDLGITVDRACELKNWLMNLVLEPDKKVAL